MSKLDEKIELYTKTLEEKCGVTADAELLRAVTRGMGPSIYNADAECVASGDEKEVNTLRQNFIVKKLGITDEAKIEAALEEVFETIGKSNTRKYRAVLSYLLVKHFSKESLYK